ncbi:MAG: DsrE family protein [Gammaproteobacteria bacterium]|nr:DsrE family protein [Gammaproteobacteria bacterium]
MKLFISMLLILSSPSIAYAIETGPWGEAKESNGSYKPQKVLYDVTTGDEKMMINILDRVSFLNNFYGNDPFDSSIVVVIHGSAIPFFARAAFAKYKETMTRAHSLTVESTIEFRMCQASAKLQGFEPRDIHGFVKMAPMADAEVVKLQKEGYAYMQ